MPRKVAKKEDLRTRLAELSGWQTATRDDASCSATITATNSRRDAMLILVPIVALLDLHAVANHVRQRHRLGNAFSEEMRRYF